jgi:hypothetical protein
MTSVEAWNKAKVGQILKASSHEYVKKHSDPMVDLYEFLQYTMDCWLASSENWRIVDPEPVKHKVKFKYGDFKKDQACNRPKQEENCIECAGIQEMLEHEGYKVPKGPVDMEITIEWEE